MTQPVDLNLVRKKKKNFEGSKGSHLPHPSNTDDCLASPLLPLLFFALPPPLSIFF
jgi:hypothetical protein